MPKGDDDKLFNNPDIEGEAQKSPLLSGLFNKIKSKGEEIKAAGESFAKDKKDLSDLKTGLANEQGKRAPINPFGTKPSEEIKGEDATAVKKQADSKDEKADIKEKVVMSARRWRAPKILKTNLIKGEVTTFIDWRKNFLVLIASFLLSALIIVVVFNGLVYWEIKESEKAQELDDELRILSQTIIKAEEEAAVVDVFESKLTQANRLLNNHIKWSNLIGFLEQNLIDTVFITSGISADTKGKYSISLKGKDYSDITKQIKVFKENELITDVWVKSGSLGEAQKDELLINRGVNFALDFELVNDFFIRP